MRIALIAIIALLLAACGSRESQAVSACEAEIANKMGNTKYSVDSSDMGARAAAEEDNILRIQSSITIDPGLPSEKVQTFDCRVRFDGDRADVISMSFTW